MNKIYWVYCTILIDSSGGVTCDQLDEISPPASQHVTWDKPEISANCQNLPAGAHLSIATFSDIKYVEYSFSYSFIQELSRSRNAHLVSLCSIVGYQIQNKNLSSKCFLLSKIQLGYLIESCPYGSKKKVNFGIFDQWFFDTGHYFGDLGQAMDFGHIHLPCDA